MTVKGYSTLIKAPALLDVCLFVCLFVFYGMSTFVGWHAIILMIDNAKSIFYTNKQFHFKQFSLAWVHSLIVKTFLFQLSKFLGRGLMIFITKGFRTIVFIFIVISSGNNNKDEYKSPKTLSDKNFYFQLLGLVKQF